MAIADTINSIRTHLETDYEALENIGAELENVDKNIENIAVVVNGIYDNLPKTTGEDTNLSLTTLKGKMNIIPKGDTNQYSTQGYQLLNSTLATSTQGTIAVTNNGDGSYTLNGTANSTVAVKIGDGITLENGSDYTLFVFNESTIGNTSTSGTWCDLRLSNSSGNIINGCSVAWGTANAKVTKNITSDYTNAKVEFRVGSGITLNNFKIKPMLIKGNDTTKTFEKYTGNIASPNPTYPQNIEVVTGTQTITISNSDNTETQTQTISLGDIELCKIGNYQDYLYKSNDKWYKKEYILKIQLTSGLTWAVSGSGYWYYISNYNSRLNKTANSDIMSNYFTKGNWGVQSENTICLGNSVDGIVGISKTSFSTLEELKTFLNNNNVYAYALLQVANDIEITNEILIEQLNNLEKAHSYNGTTNISSSGNLSAILSVSALKGE